MATEQKPTTTHTGEVAATVAAFERLMDRMAAAHQPPMDVTISMAQLRCLHVIAASGEVHMSRLVSQLGVSISTVSGLVDRLVESIQDTHKDDAIKKLEKMIDAE